MLRSIKDLEHYAIGATDGDIGHVEDFYFDDDAWVIRYLVVDTGTWLVGRQVLISPISILEPDWITRTLPVSITREQVRNSPDIDTRQPVSRQHESLYLQYYGYDNYWGGESMWGNSIFPFTMIPGFVGYGAGRPGSAQEEAAFRQAERERVRNADPHLRSCNAIVGYQLHATDGDIGHVDGFLLDEDTWAIRYLVVETGHWWLGHKVLIAPAWISAVSWADRSVSVNLGRDAVRNSPPYVVGADWSRERDIRLYEHYGRTWYGAGAMSLASGF
jgi:uncharacterized protein YrrD